MRIEEDVKLDYKDVLIRPKRSTLGSRKEVDLERGFTFRNYTPEFPENIEYRHWRGTPIMAANMDGVGTFEMADTLATGGIFTCLVKTYSVNELVGYFDQDDRSHDPARTEFVAMSIGIPSILLYEQRYRICFWISWNNRAAQNFKLNGKCIRHSDVFG